MDVIYAAMPIYVYLNPNITGYLLSPLLDYQKSLQGTNGAKGYAEIDLGKVVAKPSIYSHSSTPGGGFPNATGTTNDTPNDGIEREFSSNPYHLFYNRLPFRICKYDHFIFNTRENIW